jgi:hypothetical protein
MPVYKDKEQGTWYVNASYTNVFGKRIYIKKRGFKKRSLANDYERKALLEAQEIKKQAIKFDTLFNAFMDYKSKTLKPRSIFDYNSIYKKHIKDYFGDMYIDKIKVIHIETWQNELLKLDYKNDYLEKIQYTVKSTLAYGVRKMQIEKSPFDYIDYVKHTNEKREEMKFFTPEQYEKFRSMITDELHIALFDTLYWTGMRISELQARTWKDLNFKTGDLRIHSNYDNKNRQITNSTKNKKDRIIYIPEKVLDELERIYVNSSQIDGFTDDFYIFGNNRPIPHKTVENAKNRYITKYNELHPKRPIPKIRLHDFRHSHVSYLTNNGADVWDIAERLGHSREMVENRYSHMFPEKRNKMKKLLD